jgi:hypothetical protein
MDVSTMSLKSIIKCAYAKERARLDEEKRKKVTFTPVSHNRLECPVVTSHLFCRCRMPSFWAG